METIQRTPPASMYLRLMGAEWDKLDEPVRRFHGDVKRTRWIGSFTIRRGTGFAARVLAWLMRLPRAGGAVPTKLVVTPHASGERWHRTFAGRSFITQQREDAAHLLAERIGLTEIWYRLDAVDGALNYIQTRAGLRLGPLRVPLPSWWSPHIAAREWGKGREAGVHVSVRVTLPLAGLLIAYEGYVEREEET